MLQWSIVLKLHFFPTCINGPGVEPVKDRNGKKGIDRAHHRSEAGHEAKSGAVDKHEEASLLDEVVEYVSGYGFLVFNIYILFLS